MASPRTTARPESATAPTSCRRTSPAGLTCGTWPRSTPTRSCSPTSTATASARPCKYKGYSVNSTDENELNQALQALLHIKPHLLALKSYNIGAGLAKGSYVIAMDWDYDIALAQAENSNIKWVLPSEGASAYLEGFFAVKDTSHLEVLEALLQLLPRAEAVRRLRQHHRHRVRQ